MKVLLVEQMGGASFYPTSFFRKFGHEVFEVDLSIFYNAFFYRGIWKIHSTTWKDWISYQIFNMVKKIKPDVILFYNLEYIDVNIINKIKYLFPSTKLVCWHGDDLINHRFDKFNQLPKIPLIDIHVTPRYHLANDYLNLGAKEVLKISWFHKEMRTSQSVKIYDLNFIGSVDPKRKLFIEKVNNDCFVIAGYGWNYKTFNSIKTFKHLSLKQMNDLISASKISLNFLTEANRDRTNFRNFEIPSQFSLQITERSDEICDIFGEDVGVVCFQTPEEMNDKIKYYLKRDHQRNKITIKSNNIIKDSKYSIDFQLSIILKRILQ